MRFRAGNTLGFEAKSGVAPVRGKLPPHIFSSRTAYNPVLCLQHREARQTANGNCDTQTGIAVQGSKAEPRRIMSSPFPAPAAARRPETEIVPRSNCVQNRGRKRKCGPRRAIDASALEFISQTRFRVVPWRGRGNDEPALMSFPAAFEHQTQADQGQRRGSGFGNDSAGVPGKRFVRVVLQSRERDRLVAV